MFMSIKMQFANQKTSLITILSSTHGRLRREQRDIDKRCLQKALKHGRMQKAWGQRWLVEYDGITFITDESMRREITAYPSPLPKVPIDTEMMSQHEKAQLLFKRKPELATSHTVIVIDNSGSMLNKKNNVHLYRDSQNAAFSMTALEFVAEQLFSKTAANSDLISLIKFDEKPSVEINCEPIGWTVYNKMLDHRNVQKFVDRQKAPVHDSIYGGSNYLPALDKATELLESGYHDKSALSLFLFSDGCPTDHQKLQVSTSKAKQMICEKVVSMATRFGESFTVSIVGLGNVNDDFSVLQAMESAASTKAKGKFEFCNKTHNSLSSAISSLVSSTTESRISLQGGRKHGYTERKDICSEEDADVTYDWQYFWIQNHYVYHPGVKHFIPTARLPLAAAESNPTEAAERIRNPPRYFAMNRNYFGKGAERVAFRCRLSDSKDNVSGFVFDTMVAKETQHIELFKEKMKFHEGFAETQDLAHYLAVAFNKHLRGLPHYDPVKTPRLAFLSCSVLLLHDPNANGERGVLVEKLLDTERFQWTKWNDNNGMVDGKREHVDLDVDFELRELNKEQAFKDANGLGAITEEDEEEDSDDEGSVSDVESEDGSEASETGAHVTGGIKASDYLQAFTHFTYRYTQRKVMVCDLQGVFNNDMTPPTFELTDPAIHYSSAKGRRMVFGRTDRGRSGMNNFFNTHKCTKICKFLQLSAKNKKWNRDWRRDSSKAQNLGCRS